MPSSRRHGLIHSVVQANYELEWRLKFPLICGASSRDDSVTVGAVEATVAGIVTDHSKVAGRVAG